MPAFKQERLEYLANVLAVHCCTNEPCIFSSISKCPFEHDNCGDITPTDWIKYMQGIEVSKLCWKYLLG